MKKHQKQSDEPLKEFIKQNPDSSFIMVKTLSGTTTPYVFEAHKTTVLDLKNDICNRKKLIPSNVRLIYSGKKLDDDDKTLSSYGITKEVDIHLVTKRLSYTANNNELNDQTKKSFTASSESPSPQSNPFYSIEPELEEEQKISTVPDSLSSLLNECLYSRQSDNRLRQILKNSDFLTIPEVQLVYKFFLQLLKDKSDDEDNYLRRVQETNDFPSICLILYPKKVNHTQTYQGQCNTHLDAFNMTSQFAQNYSSDVITFLRNNLEQKQSATTLAMVKDFDSPYSDGHFVALHIDARGNIFIYDSIGGNSINDERTLYETLIKLALEHEIKFGNNSTVRIISPSDACSQSEANCGIHAAINAAYLQDGRPIPQIHSNDWMKIEETIRNCLFQLMQKKWSIDQAKQQLLSVLHDLSATFSEVKQESSIEISSSDFNSQLITVSFQDTKRRIAYETECPDSMTLNQAIEKIKQENRNDAIDTINILDFKVSNLDYDAVLLEDLITNDSKRIDLSADIIKKENSVSIEYEYTMPNFKLVDSQKPKQYQQQWKYNRSVVEQEEKVILEEEDELNYDNSANKKIGFIHYLEEIQLYSLKDQIGELDSTTGIPKNYYCPISREVIQGYVAKIEENDGSEYYFSEQYLTEYRYKDDSDSDCFNNPATNKMVKGIQVSRDDNRQKEIENYLTFRRYINQMHIELFNSPEVTDKDIFKLQVLIFGCKPPEPEKVSFFNDNFEQIKKYLLNANHQSSQECKIDTLLIKFQAWKSNGFIHRNELKAAIDDYQTTSCCLCLFAQAGPELGALQKLLNGNRNKTCFSKSEVKQAILSVRYANLNNCFGKSEAHRMNLIDNPDSHPTDKTGVSEVIRTISRKINTSNVMQNNSRIQLYSE